MIGDWVRTKYGSAPFQILSIISSEPFKTVVSTEGFDVDIADLQPIPLTPEILEKNGWSYNDEEAKFAPETWSGGGLILQGHEDSGFMIMATSDYDDEDTNHTPFILNYVHELQHALRLRRLSKEIIL